MVLPHYYYFTDRRSGAEVDRQVLKEQRTGDDYDEDTVEKKRTTAQCKKLIFDRFFMPLSLTEQEGSGLDFNYLPCTY